MCVRVCVHEVLAKPHRKGVRERGGSESETVKSY